MEQVKLKVGQTVRTFTGSVYRDIAKVPDHPGIWYGILVRPGSIANRPDIVDGRLPGQAYKFGACAVTLAAGPAEFELMELKEAGHA